MPRNIFLFVAAVFLNNLIAAYAAVDCVECHRAVTPNIVADWQASKHSKGSAGCATCHGSAHISEKDAAQARMPTSGTCSGCHKKQFEQFNKGKHSRAWTAMNAMPAIHWEPVLLVDGLLGCGGCHKLGNKSEAEIRELNKKGTVYGMAACDACHTRHAFSLQEARQPQACQTCHMGFDHPQWEMYSSSKHGIRYLLKQNNALSSAGEAPACQTCHMQAGDHAVRAAWGFLAVRLPMPDDPQWAKDRGVILRALGAVDGQGKTTARFEKMKASDVVRTTQEDWQKERDSMIGTCAKCHSSGYASAQLKRADGIIREADHIMAEAITIVGDLYAQGLLKKKDPSSDAYPDILMFHNVSSSIEKTLFLMFKEYRMRTFQGAFHNNPDYTFWYGWSAMQQALTDIKEMARGLRKDAR
ncbi:MAG: multiheme c-type cytochrome [Candidatus Omnitrophota bacterium]